MARLTRKQQKIFAENATNNGVFGSLQSNNPITSNDPDVLQGRPAFEEGWNDATYSAELLPPLEEFQGLQYLFSRQFAYLFQEGIAEWDANTTYYKGSIVKTISGTQIVVYLSLIDNNIGNQATDTTKWQKLFDSDDNYAFDALVVHKSGSETITGDKTFTGSNEFTGTSLITGTPNLKNTALATNGTTPSSNTAFPIHFMANDDSITGYIRSRQSTGGLYVMDIVARRNVSGSTIDAALQVYVDSSGNTYATAPTPSSATDNSIRIATTSWVRNHRCTTPATTTSTASADAPAYVVENYKAGASQWYRVWSDGWIEQGGVIGSIGINGTGTLNLNKAFTSVGYTLIMTAGNDTTSAGFDTGTNGCGVYTKKNTGNFKWKLQHFSDQYYATQMAWYACGY